MIWKSQKRHNFCSSLWLSLPSKPNQTKVIRFDFFSVPLSVCTVPLNAIKYIAMKNVQATAIHFRLIVRSVHIQAQHDTYKASISHDDIQPMILTPFIFLSYLSSDRFQRKKNDTNILYRCGSSSIQRDQNDKQLRKYFH